ncbi:preprotein translocase subunit SecE [Proteinivorax hydrogeniformans]|uniref:Protein translocase subunit SecE n=1 Tax=Proteinivorax hydrogeniformans TaxID=1826727 RepID=A0AAU8HTN0_9FIRM
MGMIQKSKSFFKGVKTELKKVQWPNRKELTTYTIVVISTVLVVAAVIALMDTIYGSIIGLIAG